MISEESRDERSPSKTQSNLLQTAVMEGYFDVPRRITLVELAEKHDLTDREASRKLRHGLKQVVEETFEE